MTNSLPTQIGSYRILGLLGQNRWHESYLASHLTSEHKVVIKLFTLTKLSRNMRGRFAWQLATLQKLDPDHPHLIEIEDVGSYDNRPYLVLDYVPGGNLAELIHSQVLLQMPIAEVWYILKGLAEALDHIHEQGVVHGQVEPETILFDEEGEPHLSHVQLLNISSRSAFSSPEQRAGQVLSHQADVYSLAAVAYMMLTNTPPAATNPKPITELRPGLPQTFDKLFQQGLAQRAEERFNSAGAFVEAFEEALSVSSRLKKPVVRNFLFVFSVGLIIFFTFFFNSFKERQPTVIRVYAPTLIPTLTSTPMAVETGIFYLPISNRPIEMVYIYSGSFINPYDKNNKINLEGFWIDAQETTFLEFFDYIEAVGEQNVDQYLVARVSLSKSTNPIESISWNSARDYCLWRGGDLPSEYQWTKASYAPQVKNMFGAGVLWEWTARPYLKNGSPSTRIALGGRAGERIRERSDFDLSYTGFRCVINVDITEITPASATPTNPGFSVTPYPTTTLIPTYTPNP